MVSVMDVVVIVVPALIAILSGFLVPVFFRIAGLKSKTAPVGAARDVWDALQPAGIENSGAWLGSLERLLVFGAVWTDTNEIILAWLALKIAAKWDTWSHVLKLPDSIDGVDPIAYLRTRRIWGSVLMMRFLVGTLANLLLGMTAAHVGRFLGQSTF